MQVTNATSYKWYKLQMVQFTNATSYKCYMFMRKKEKEKKKKGNTDNKIGTDIQTNKHRNTHYHIFTCTEKRQ